MPLLRPALLELLIEEFVTLGHFFAPYFLRLSQPQQRVFLTTVERERGRERRMRVG
jgi:hypothetical protein